jgi:hypothetical protein
VSSAAGLVPLAPAENVVPDPGRLIFALRQIGYSLEQAISDLIDNAVSAGAENVLIRFIWSSEEISGVAVADDGSGMSPDELRSAMRFGSPERLDRTSLGKFGLGLKLASFSHARKLTVVTSDGSSCSGRRWTIDGIRRHWDCETLSDQQAIDLCNAPWSPLEISSQGTVVIWDDIDKLPVSGRGLRHTLRSLHRRLDLHLGLHFHRFIRDGRLRIHIDQQQQGISEHQIRVEVPPLDPFSYPDSPLPDYPRVFRLQITGVGELDAEAHIWPANSEATEYKLGNRAAARQGFYFYRNDRLIQAGGWNGLVQAESEPHSSLARVKIDLPTGYDTSFSLNVQKSSVIVPPGFVEAVQTAKDNAGGGFESFRQAAQSLYRRRDSRSLAKRLPIPASGVPASLAEEFAQRSPVSKEPSRPIEVRWTPLENDNFFRIDAAGGQLLLNERYRNSVLLGLRGHTEDVPLVKTLLFLLLQQDLNVMRPSDKRRRELAVINQLLAAAADLRDG